MAKARRPRRDSERIPAVTPGESGSDPLGKLVEQHGVTLAGVLVVTGVISLAGIGLIGYGMTREPRSLTLIVIGGIVLLCGLSLLGINIPNVGRRLEVRKRGIRFTQAGITTEFRWDEIDSVDVNRTDDTYLGVASVRRKSSDTIRSSGPLTKTEWDVTIRSQDGRTIRLTPIFLRTLAKPKDVVRNIELRAGLAAGR